MAIQFLLLIAFIFQILSQHQETKGKILAFQTVAYFGQMLSYFFLHAPTACWITFLSLLRSIAFSKERKDNIYFLWLLVLALIPVYWITYAGIYCIFPILATLSMDWGTYQKNLTLLRCIFVFNALNWLIYNIFIKAYAGALGNLIEIISVLLAIIRLDLSKNRD